MKRLSLFTVFHANLDFSALPDRDLPLVISRCYWPLLALAEEAGMPLGIEMSARTLRRIADEDPEWSKTFRELAGRGLVELVGSGWAQVIGPLTPVDVNRANLALGREAYAELLGAAPETWFVNEQTFSDGIGPLYRGVGAASLVMEWNNPASAQPELRPLRFRPARLRTGADSGISLLWNDCIFFQKLQRVAHGEAPASEFIDAVARVRGLAEASLLCVYGGDLEIFDYRPGRNSPSGAVEGAEMRRLAACLRALAADPRYRFALPRDAARGEPAGPEVRLSSAREPIPCKKQPRYNPTRWAVSGRDGFGMNTQCFALRRELRALAALCVASGNPSAEDHTRALVELWGSDYRTRATEERVEQFHRSMGAASVGVRAALQRAAPPLAEGEDLLLLNPWDEPWEGTPVQVDLRFPPGRLRAARVVAEPESALAPGSHQLEVSSRHRDGSLRRATLVLEPRIDPHGKLGLRLLPDREQPEPTGPSPDGLRTREVEASFLLHRGGALAELRFPRVDPAPLAGTVPHGTFEEIAYTPDFFTGHVVAVTEATEKVTDLVQVSAAAVRNDGPVRTTLELQVETRLGEWTKLYHVYQHHPRVDLVHVLRFNEARINSLRLGILTLAPQSFDRESLRYATINGGSDPEEFALGAGVSVAQHRAASASVSASSCLGATEGWVSVGDARRGIALITDRSQAAAVPLLEFSEVDDRFFLRLHHTAAETDETRATFFRGVRRFSFAAVGHRNDLGAVRRVARGIESGLVARTERGVGIARGL